MNQRLRNKVLKQFLKREKKIHTGESRTLFTFFAAKFFDLGEGTASRPVNPGSGVLALLRRSALASRRREKNLV